MTTEHTDPFADLDAIPALLEDGIETITGHRPLTEQAIANGMTRDMRAGGAAGILIGTAIRAYYALAVDGAPAPAFDMHHALVIALESCAGEHRANVAHTLINILTTWLATDNMVDQLGPQAAAAIDHLESAYGHIAAGADEDAEAMPTHDDGVEAFAPSSVPSGAVERLGEAASALGITPFINVEVADDGDLDDAHNHPVVPVALMSGIVIGRATMELLEMVDSANDHMQMHAAPLWVTGFSRGVAMGEEPRDDIVVAAALRLCNIIGLWNDNRTGAKYAPAIGALCRAANHAGRAGALISAPVDVRAEQIANGTDEAEAARKALAAAEDAVKALKDTGVTI